MKFIDLHVQQHRIRKKIDERIKKVLDHGQYIMGPEVFELESALASYVEVNDCISVASGTDALLVALMALGIGVGDEVITTPLTFIATAESILLLGAKPVFVDVDRQTYNIDSNNIEEAITEKTKAILPVSLYGQCAHMDAINDIAQRHNIAVVEDSAQSLGATYRGKQSGSLSTISCTSFYPSKPLGGYGDAGACFTNDKLLATAMKEIRLHGQNKRYSHSRLGINGRMDTLQAAILLAKYELFHEEVKLRMQVGSRYSELLIDADIPIQTPYIDKGNTSIYAQYTILVNDRDKLREKLTQSGIPTAVHYPIPLHKQDVCINCISHDGPLAISENLCERILSLPMHPYLTKHNQDFIIKTIVSEYK